MHVRYDGQADWYESVFAEGSTRATVDALVQQLLGPGDGICLDVCCGTGLNVEAIQATGRSWVGVDVSSDMLRIAKRRHVNTYRGDAGHLPVASTSCDAAVATYMHTDVDDFRAAVREISRILRPGAPFVYVGNHPCFVGTFVRRDREEENGELVFRPGYTSGGWQDIHRPGGLGSRVGRRHVPLPEFLHAFIDAGLAIERFSEFGGTVVPWDLAIRARKFA